MKKSILLDFISKYNLGGQAEAVLLTVNNKKLNCEFRTEGKSTRGTITFNDIELKDGTLGIFQTVNLRSILSALEEDIDVSYVADPDDDERLMKIAFKDKNMKAEFVLADPTIIDSDFPEKNVPAEDISFVLTHDFITGFNKAKSALSTEAPSFAITASGDGIIKIILNYQKDINSNRFEFKIPAKKDSDMEPIFFNADIFKEILNANKNCTRGAMKVSSKGVATIVFQGDNFKTEYLLMRINQ